MIATPSKAIPDGSGIVARKIGPMIKSLLLSVILVTFSFLNVAPVIVTSADAFNIPVDEG